MAHTSDKCPGVTTHKRVTFNDSVREHKVLAHSSVYGVHPSTFVVTQSGLKTVSTDVDPFTGKSGTIMRARIDKQRRDMQGVHNRRRFILALLSNAQPSSAIAGSSTAGADMRKSQHGYMIDKHMVYMYDGLATNTIGTTETEIVGNLVDENVGVEEVMDSLDVARLEMYSSVDALCAAEHFRLKTSFRRDKGLRQ